MDLTSFDKIINITKKISLDNLSSCNYCLNSDIHILVNKIFFRKD